MDDWEFIDVSSLPNGKIWVAETQEKCKEDASNDKLAKRKDQSDYIGFVLRPWGSEAGKVCFRFLSSPCSDLTAGPGQFRSSETVCVEKGYMGSLENALNLAEQKFSKRMVDFGTPEKWVDAYGRQAKKLSMPPQ